MVISILGVGSQTPDKGLFNYHRCILCMKIKDSADMISFAVATSSLWHTTCCCVEQLRISLM